MNTVKLPPEGPRGWLGCVVEEAKRVVEESKETRLATRVIGGLALVATSLGVGSGVGEVATNFNESNRETSCHTASVVIQSDFVDGVPQISLSPESEDEINSFLQWEPGGYRADAINANALAYDPATGAFAQGEAEIQVCVTKAPLSVLILAWQVSNLLT